MYVCVWGNLKGSGQCYINAKHEILKPLPQAPKNPQNILLSHFRDLKLKVSYMIIEEISLPGLGLYKMGCCYKNKDKKNDLLGRGRGK